MTHRDHQNKNLPRFHALIRRGDLEGARKLLEAAGEKGMAPNDQELGISPLCQAFQSSLADEKMVDLLLAHGASIRDSKDHYGRNALRCCLAQGSVRKVEALLQAGADVQGHDEHHYDALLSATSGRDVTRDTQLLRLLSLLVQRGAPLGGVSTYGETALDNLVFSARFDAVQLLLDAGADADQVGLTPLGRIVALGSLAELEQALANGATVNDWDARGRSSFMIAIMAGDLEKARLLLARGADPKALDQNELSAIFHAISSHQPHALEWLLELGLDPNSGTSKGYTPLQHSAQCDDAECTALLLAHGARVDEPWGGGVPLRNARSRAVILQLLQAGADPANLASSGQRMLIGYGEFEAESLLDVSEQDFRRGRTPRRGTANPESMNERFWLAMIRSGVSAYRATQFFSGSSSFSAGPVWCAERFGQSITRLNDGRWVQVGGEHEDHYDPDFYIYNDVFVHELDGTIKVFGYPESVFPPTDFHTATLINDQIYLIGSLGYRFDPSRSLVYCLDTRTFQISPFDALGPSPSDIHGHRAFLRGEHEIEIFGGKRWARDGDGDTEHLVANEQRFVLDVQERRWRRVGGEP